MPKKPTGDTPSSGGKSNPLSKATVPMKTPSIKASALPEPISSPSGVASMPGSRFPTLSKPPKMTTRAPRI